MAIALEHSGVQVQAVALAALRQARHLPIRQGVEETMHVAHAKAAEHIADGVVNREVAQAEQDM